MGAFNCQSPDWPYRALARRHEGRLSHDYHPPFPPHSPLPSPPPPPPPPAAAAAGPVYTAAALCDSLVCLPTDSHSIVNKLPSSCPEGRLARTCGLRRLASPTFERVRRAPARGSGVATTRARRTTPPSFLLSTRRNSLPGIGQRASRRHHGCPLTQILITQGRMTCLSCKPPFSVFFELTGDCGTWGHPRPGLELALP